MTATHHSEFDRMMVWVDGVGAYLLCGGNRTTIGGPMTDGNAPEISLLANLSRCHATIVREGEQYLVDPHGDTRLNGRSIRHKSPLNHGYEIGLGDTVELRFRIPTALSVTAVLDFISDHRPPQSVDGVILMGDNCLLGSGRDNHIHCPDWPESVILFRRGQKMYCKSKLELFVDELPTKHNQSVELSAGAVVSSEQVCFRMEAF